MEEETLVLMLAGTLPIEKMELTVGKIKFDGQNLSIGDKVIGSELISVGATAMMAASATTCEALGFEPPVAAVAGDMGKGDGSTLLYKYLAEEAGTIGPSTLTLHYILPIRKGFMDFIEILDYWEKKPFLTADAGSMLIAKATSSCRKFDLFTPDAGEICFLADPEAGHPAYVKSMLFEIDTTDVPRLIQQAYEHGNAPRYLLIKGPIDFIVEEGRIIYTLKEPDIPVLEPIGGTGDTITGTVSALIDANYEPTRACLLAARSNRLAGQLAGPTPATKVLDIVKHIGEAVKKVAAEAE
jgi:hypothetical protein